LVDKGDVRQVHGWLSSSLSGTDLDTGIERSPGASAGWNPITCIAPDPRNGRRWGGGLERYRSTYFNDAWLAERGLGDAGAEAEIERFFDTGG
jgi:hypothetical protein